MKYASRTTMLIVALMLFGCGGGGENSPSTTSSTPSPAGTSTSFTLTIVDGTSTAARAAQIAMPRILATTLPSTPNYARVIFRNISSVTSQFPVYDDNGNFTGEYSTITQLTEIYKRVVDAPYANPLTVTVPPSPARGYIIDVLTYNDDGSQNYFMLKYGRSNPIVVDATHMTGSVTINPIAPTLTTSANPVYSDSTYTLTVNGGLPLRSYYKIRQDLVDASFTPYTNYSSHLPLGTLGVTRTFTSPVTYSNGTLYLPAQFYIDSSMLAGAGGAKNENYTHWTTILPLSVGITGLISVSLPLP